MKNKKTTIHISVIIVNWNTKKFLKKCLSSLIKSTHQLNVEIIVVDNNSHDESAEMISKLFPDIILFANKKNLGYAKGNNQGYKKSHGEYVFFLNPDTIVYKNTLSQLFHFMEQNQDAGSCAPKMINEDGTVQKLGFYRRTPTLMSMFISHGPLRSIAFQSSYLKSKYFEHSDFDTLHEIDQPPGACFFTRRSILNKIGGMEEKYKLYFEDVDLAYRIKQKGYKQWFIPYAKIKHFVGRSNLQLDHGKRTLLYYESMHKFFEKFHGKHQGTAIKWIVLVRYFYTIAALSLLFLPRKLINGYGGRPIIVSEIQSLYTWIKFCKWI